MSLKKPINKLSFNQTLAFGFGSGLLAFAPGTFGTLVAIPLVFLFDYVPVFFRLLIFIGLIIWGIKLCGKVAKELNQPDPKQIVFDEIVGFLWAMFLIPLSFWSVLIGFLLFRFFDIVKPFPIGYLDKKLTGGKGIMFDDLLAGFFTWILLQAIMQFGWYF